MFRVITDRNFPPRLYVNVWIEKQSVVLVELICILALGLAVNSPAVQAQIFIDESSRSPVLIEGTSLCNQSNLMGSKPGSVLKFAVACNRDLAIFAWDAPIQEANDRNECISFAFAANNSLVNLLCRSDSPASLIKAPKRSRLLLLEGAKSEVSPFACPSVFSRFGIGIFFGSDDLGFNLKMLQDGLKRSENSMNLPTGVLSWVEIAGLIESIEFNQNSESIFSSLDKNHTPVGMVTLPDNGSSEMLASRRFVVHFDKPTSLALIAPWTAHTAIEYRGVAGGFVSAEFDIKISAVHQDEALVRASIENVKELVPDGATIAPIDAVAKQWNDGRIVPVVDENAVKAADSVLWSNASGTYLLAVLLALVCVILGGTWLFRKSTGA